MITVRALTDPRELVEVDRLYREVFAVDATDTGLNVRLLTALSANGGQVVGAFEDAAPLLGFGVAFLARRDARTPLYLYSQTAAVRPGRQDTGVGRLIKHGQRERALADGIELMRWTFDPVQARNAHFNLDVLGARLIHVELDYYGPAAHAADRGERTDRATVEWPLAPGPQQLSLPALAELGPGECRPAGDGRLVGLPADWRAFRGARGAGHAHAVRDRILDAVRGALSAGLVGVSCRRLDDHRAAYTFLPGQAR